MKKFLFFAVMLVFAMPTLTGCSNNDDADDGYDFIENATFDTSLLFGSWDIEYTDTPAANSVWAGIKDIHLTFYRDGTFKMNYGNEEYESVETTSNYKVKGGTITLDLEPSIAIEPTRMDASDVYFLATCSGQAVYCKGTRR